MTEVPPVVDGHITVPRGPGLGLDLAPDLDRRFNVIRKTSVAEA